MPVASGGGPPSIDAKEQRVTQQTLIDTTRWMVTFLCPLVFALASTGTWAADVEAVKRLSSEGRWNEVLAATEGRPQGGSADAQVMFLRAVALARVGRTDDAIRTYQSLLVVQPDAPEAHNNMAVLLAQKGDVAKARQHFERAVEMRPDYGTALENLADVYTRLAEVTRSKARGVPLSVPTTVTTVGAAQAGSEPGSGPGLPATANSVKVAPKNVSLVTGAPRGGAAPASGNSEAAVRAPAASSAGSSPVGAVATGTPIAPTEDQRAAASMIAEWAAAWSAKDVGRYLSFYSANFKPTSGITRQTWEAQRRKRIEDKGAISVTPMDVEVMTTQGRTEATFRQLYRAGPLYSSEKKRMVLVKEGTRWLIAAEDRLR
jgi:hypothetical protein